MAKMRDLDWDDLRFVACALHARSLAASARLLGVEHSTVGRRLSALERALGSPLVLRTSEGLRPTALGRKAMPLITELERIVEDLRELAASEQRRVRLATPSGLVSLFSGELGQLAKDHPQIELEIVSGARPVDLANGEADLAIRSGPITDPNLVARKLCDSGFSLYASADYLSPSAAPLDMHDLSGHEFIGLDPAFSHTPPARWIAEHAASANIVFRAREMTDVLAAAQAGVGIAVLPCLLAFDAPGLHRLTPDVVTSHRLWLAYRREARNSKQVAIVSRWIVELIRRNAALISGTAGRPRSGDAA